MDYIEIILEDVPTKKIDELFREIIEFDFGDIISSHFFDEEHNKDIDFYEIRSLESHFKHFGTGNLFLKNIKIGIELKEVIIIISCNRKMGDITINFSEEQFKENKVENDIKKLVQTLSKIQKKNFANKIIVGYEPASDGDMNIFEFLQGHMKICNEELIQTPFMQQFKKAFLMYELL